MAYTTPNIGIIRPWNVRKNRYVHRQMRLTIGGTGKGGGSTGTASDSVSIPCPGRLIAYQAGAPDATHWEAGQGVVTGGVVTVKAETTAGVAILTSNALSTAIAVPTGLGTTALDEGAAATAATDAFSGGFPVRGGVFASVASGTDTEVIQLDLWFRLCTYVKLDLVAQSGADGSGVVTRYVPLGNAGVLSAIAVDYQNEPSTTDIVIYAESASGPVLHTRTSSLTDLAPTLLGAPGADEGADASAATDGTECSLAFKRGLYVDVAQANAFTSSDERIILEMWIDD